jgi:tetratricopeptide (TPR) repeat protein
MKVSTVLQDAFLRHQANDLDAAVLGYAQVLAIDPLHPDALNLLGVVYSQKKDYPRAINQLLKAIASKVGFIDAWLNLAKTFSSAGRFEEAAGACNVVLRLQPLHAEALATLARTLRKLKQFEATLTTARHFLAQSPGDLEMCRLEATCLIELQDYAQALVCFEKLLQKYPTDLLVRNDYAMALAAMERQPEAIELLRPLTLESPPFGPACSNLANLLSAQGAHEEALVLHALGMKVQPTLYAGWVNYANALQKIGDSAQARQALERAIELKPERAEARVNLASLLMGLGETEEAFKALQQALDLAPEFVDAWNNLGAMKLDHAQPKAAHEAYARAASLAPDMANAQFGLALSCLMQGDFEHGWPLYEWRWLGASQSKPKERPRFKYPQWTGQATDATRHALLVYHEQGFGDTVQFLRFIPGLEKRFMRVVLVIQPPLMAMARAALPASIELVSSDEGTPFLKKNMMHWHCPMGSLPLALGVNRLSKIPSTERYLRLPPKHQCDDRLTSLAARAKAQGKSMVGICWAGNPDLAHDATRSLKLDMLEDMMRHTDVQWVSLQRERSPLEAELLKAWSVFDVAEDLKNFADTAAVIEQLDLVISVDTVITHLAGALGVRCWLLNRFQSEWRWMLGTTACAWYSSVKQFRQVQRNDWEHVLADVQQALHDEVAFGLPKTNALQAG